MRNVNHKLGVFWKLVKMSGIEFMEDNGLKLSASLSYYTVFSMAPLLIIIISLAGIFFGEEAVQGRIYGQINGLVGNMAAVQIQEIIKNVKDARHNGTGAIIGFVILLVGSSGVFAEIQDSINYIWSVRAKPKHGWLKLIINRLLSFSLIASVGFLLLVSLLVNAIIDLLNERLMFIFADTTVYLLYALNFTLLFAIISCLFALIFKVLPDAHIHWRDAFVGAFFTALLFIGGKALISFYLSTSKIGETYGAAASIILILLWVYYSSIILYFGAVFTKLYAMGHGAKIVPRRNAIFFVKQDVVKSG